MNLDRNRKALTVKIARSIDWIGTEPFEASIAELYLQTCAFDSAYISASFNDHGPCEIFSNLSKSDTTSTITPYLK